MPGTDFNLNRIQRKKIYREILEKIWQAILHNDLQPGDKLPTEKDLAQQFGVGRPTLREALTVLDYFGVLESVQGGGYYVKSLIPIQSPELMSRIGRGISPHDLTDTRLCIEPDVCGLAAMARNEDDLARLAENIRRTEITIKKGLPPTEEDHEFHLGLAEATANQMLVSIIEALISYKTQVLYEAIQSARYRHDPKLETIVVEHQQIYGAIKAGDPEKARMMMQSHLQRVKKDLFADDE